MAMKTLEKYTLTLSSEGVSTLVVIGNYSCLIGEVNDKNFPLDPSLDGEWEGDLYDSKDDSAKGAVDEMSVDDWKPATIFHLLAFGVKYPDAEKKNQIAGLGSRRGQLVPVLLNDGDGRWLILRDWYGSWSPISPDWFSRGRPSYRFLRVRRLST